MSNHPMSNHPIIDLTANGPTAGRPERTRRRGLVLVLVAIPLALGGAGLSFAQTGTGPATMAAPPAPVAIGSLATSRDVAAKGEVAEIFGNKFVVQDGTGRALVETGRRGEDTALVKTGETVTVQGRFEHGFLHATLIAHADGTQVSVGPAGGPPRGGPAEHGPGGLAWVKDKVGLGPKLDVPALTATAERAGYSDIRVTGSGPRHIEVAAKGVDGRERTLHVDVDGRIRER